MTRSNALRGCDAPSHAVRPARPVLFALSLGLLLSSCTLIQRPEPVTTLRLPLADADLAWPSALSPGRVDSTSALRSNRVLVVDGAVLMQHDGLRWVDTPAVMLSEQLRASHARAAATGAARATLDVWLGEFNLRVDADRTQEAAASAHATLRCAGSEHTITIAPVAASAAPTSSDPQALADAFAQASGEMLAALLQQSAERAADCAAP